MSQNDTRDNDPREDGVALSPYDDDLAPATEPPAPEPTLEPEFSDAPAEETAAEHAAPSWQRVHTDDEIAGEAPAAARLPYNEAAARGIDVEELADDGGPRRFDTDETVADEIPAARTEPADVAPADALADETVDEDVQTSTYQVPEPDPVSDTAVRRTSLLRPTDAEEIHEAPAVVPVAAPIPDDDRADSYGPEDPDLFAGATYDKVPSRAGAHAWSLVTILLAPIAWYLISDAGARMTLPDGAAWEIGTMNLAAIGELAAGLLVALVIMLAARASWLGVFVTGILLAIVGGAFIFAPAWTKDFIEPAQEWLRAFNPGLGGNIAHHLEWDGATGRIFVIGLGLILVAMVSHFARRRGRDEEKIRNAIALRRPQA